MTAESSTRLIALAGLALGAAVVAILLLASGSSYAIHGVFQNAEGLVTGGRVEIAGRPVGSISSITVTPNGLADVGMTVTDSTVTPLHAGTRATIRAVGLAGVTEDYVALSPGLRTAPVLRSGSTLPITQTSGIVAIDALLDAFGPTQRANLDTLIADSNQIYAGSGAREFNQMIVKLDPALAELDGFTSGLALDKGALGELVRSASTAASAVASQSPALTTAVRSTALALGAIASQRTELADLLTRAPAVLHQAQQTLGRASTSLTALRPVLHDIPPVAGPLRGTLQALDATLPAAGSAIAQLRAQLPDLDNSLRGLVPLRPIAVRAITTLGTAMQSLTPIATGVRYYSTDLVLGVLSSLFGRETSEYDSYGHYAKVNFVQSIQDLLAGPLAQQLGSHQLIPGVFGVRNGLLRRCPGGAEPPAPDGSSPWILPSSYCTPSNDVPASVDVP